MIGNDDMTEDEPEGSSWGGGGGGADAALTGARGRPARAGGSSSGKPAEPTHIIWRLLSGGVLQQVTSGKCVHPFGGKLLPDNDTQLVLFGLCDDMERPYIR